MNQSVKEKWIVALLSGDYIQTDGRLRSTDADGHASHCCLGVLCEIYVADHPEVQWSDATGALLHPDAGELPRRIMEWAELGDQDPTPLSQRSKTLASLNDGGSTFAEIADIIREDDWYVPDDDWCDGPEAADAG